jgi:16S rRNA (cytidine1402-2'-O)-methyltransferase
LDPSGGAHLKFDNQLNPMMAQDKTPKEAGVLYVVSTPIGNLEDITLRALRVLKEVDLIAAEDTRKAGILLKHFQIKNKMTSYHDFNKEKKTPYLLEELKSGKDLAIVSDAGTPGISDPCFYLVKKAIEEEIKIIPVPGSSALLSALVVSGLPTDRFVFEGFLPPKKTKRIKRLMELSSEKRTLIFFESPYRLIQTLKNINEVFGERRIVVARELTKKFEEIIRGKISDVESHFERKKVKGEMVIVVEGESKSKEFRVKS